MDLDDIRVLIGEQYEVKGFFSKWGYQMERDI